MTNEKNNDSFEYTYSAKQQDEIRNIRKKYISTEEDKMVQLRKLDTGVYQKATSLALAAGISGLMLLGMGMSLVMALNIFIPGIIIGSAGLIGIAAAYPFYLRTLKKEREKIAPEIIRLTDELLK